MLIFENVSYKDVVEQAGDGLARVSVAALAISLPHRTWRRIPSRTGWRVRRGCASWLERKKHDDLKIQQGQ